MVLHLSTPPRVCPRSLLRTLMKRLFLVSSRASLGAKLHHFLLLGLLVFFLHQLCLLATSGAGVHIQCECGPLITTGEREARYLRHIMQEADPSTNKSTMESLQKENPSLAVQFLLEEEFRGWRCGIVPGLFTVRHSNSLWQQARLGALTFHLFSAHWDDRDGEAMVRILSVSDGPRPGTPWCHFYTSGNLAPVATRAVRVDFLHWQYPVEDYWQPFLISCSADGVIPVAVSVVGAACEAPTNALKVHGAPPGPAHPGATRTRGLGQDRKFSKLDERKNKFTQDFQLLDDVSQNSVTQGKQNWEDSQLSSLEQATGTSMEMKVKHGYSEIHRRDDTMVERSKQISETVPIDKLKTKNTVIPDKSDVKLHESKQNSYLKAESENNLLLTQEYEISRVKEKAAYRDLETRKGGAFELRKVKKNLALCHKFLFNENKDDSLRLIEWLEAARAWGVDDVTMYVHSAHKNVMRVLQLYGEEGFVTLVPWSNPGHYPNNPTLQRALYDTQRYALFTLENIPHTDCLLRHIHTHRYVAVWDMDEFLIPAPPYASISQMLDNAKLKWYEAHPKCFERYIADKISKKSYNSSIILQLLDQLKEKEVYPECRPPVSYLGRCSYFFDDLLEPPDNSTVGLHMLRHVTRTFKVTKPKVFTKAVHDTSRALGLHAHFALYSRAGAVDRQHDLYDLYPSDEGYLGHYRSKCQGESQEECEEEFRPYLQRDERMWLYKTQISRKSRASMEALELTP